MKKVILALGISLSLASGAFAGQTVKAVDTSIDGIYTALASSHNLQKTADQLIANGATPQLIVSIAAAAGIQQNKIGKLQLCVNTISADSKTLGATCLLPKTVLTAYESGLNDRLSYLPATAAGKSVKK